jgi:putative ABC transport system permease protein
MGNVTVATAGIIVLTTVVALLACRRAVRLQAVVALRADPSGGRAAASLSRGPVVLARAIGSLRAGGMRSVLGGVALALAAGGLVMATLMQGSLGAFVAHLAFDGARPGDLLASSAAPPADVAATLRATPGVTAVVWETNLTMQLPGGGDTYNLRVRSGDLAAVPQPLESGAQLAAPGDLVVGFGLARAHHIGVGQQLALDVAGAPRTFRVVGVNREIDNVGLMATTLAASLPRDTVFAAPVFYAVITPGYRAAQVAARVNRESHGVINAGVISNASLPPILRTIPTVIGALAVVLALLTGLGVFNTVFLSVQERRREFAISRAVGMAVGQVLATTVVGMVVLAAIASLFAVPSAVVLGRGAMDSITAGLGIGHPSLPVPLATMLVGPGVLIIAAVAAAGPAWSASTTDIVDALRTA